MKFFTQSNFLKLLFIMLSIICFFAINTTSFAFSITVTGNEANTFRKVLQVLPYTPVGTGDKVVYVFGRPTCSATTDFYLHTNRLQKEYEFRWVIEPDLVERNDCAGLFESRSAEQLEEIFFDETPIPAKDKKRAVIFSEIVNITPQLLGEIAGTDGRYMLPLLVFDTGDSVQYISGTTDFFNGKKLRAIIEPAQHMKDSELFDIDVGIKLATDRVPASGKFCVKQSAIQAKLLPHMDAPGFMNQLTPNSCWTIRQSIADGWLGVQRYSDPNLALGYVKKSEGTIR